MGKARPFIRSVIRILVFPLSIAFHPAVLPSTGPLIAFLGGWFIAGNGRLYPPAFFGAAAQVIPVLLLVLAVEARFFRLNLVPLEEIARGVFDALIPKGAQSAQHSGPFALMATLYRHPVGLYVFQRTQVVIVLAVLVAGEVVSFLALGADSPGRVCQQIALGAIWAGLVSVVVTALVGPAAAKSLSSSDLGDRSEVGHEESGSDTHPGMRRPHDAMPEEGLEPPTRGL